MAQKRVFIYESEGELRVYPPLIVLNNGDSLTIVNGAEENVDWEVPANVFDGNPHFEKVSQKSKSLAKVLPNTATATASTYQVTGRSTKRKGKGNSDPVIIIDV